MQLEVVCTCSGILHVSSVVVERRELFNWQERTSVTKPVFFADKDTLRTLDERCHLLHD